MSGPVIIANPTDVRYMPIASPFLPSGENVVANDINVVWSEAKVMACKIRIK